MMTRKNLINIFKVWARYAIGYTYLDFYKEPNKQIKKQGKFNKNNRADGMLWEFYENGTLSAISKWKNGNMIYMIEYAQDGKVVKSYGEVPK